MQNHVAGREGQIWKLCVMCDFKYATHSLTMVWVGKNKSCMGIQKQIICTHLPGRILLYGLYTVIYY